MVEEVAASPVVEQRACERRVETTPGGRGSRTELDALDVDAHGDVRGLGPYVSAVADLHDQLRRASAISLVGTHVTVSPAPIKTRNSRPDTCRSSSTAQRSRGYLVAAHRVRLSCPAAVAGTVIEGT
ncbi:hypothetical protein GCM10009843_28480 [Nocardioides bigeumensis]|uniref:Uncharacterized protein n=1 Tax=Nocardioides bigeumensis TaxID=433657 RepID=A0ABN2YLJ6_9ACTN